MMPLLILFPAALFVVLMTGISMWGYRRYARPAKVLMRLEEPLFTGQETVAAESAPNQPPAFLNALERVGRLMPVSPVDLQNVRRGLVRAGYRAESAPMIFYGIKIFSIAALLVLALALRDSLTQNPVLRVAFVIGGAVAGFMLPDVLLERSARRRQERLLLSLPDALDLMVVSVEAGLGLDQAMLYVTRELQMTHREISEELGLVNLEMRAGKRRADALRNLADRTGEDEIGKLVAILIQNDRFGTSMAESLRTHSDFMRTRRRQDAEERAGKVGVKLVFPIFFFILPSMMLVTAGPGILQIFKNLFPMMGRIH
jgi:tight adherence protein C